MTTASSAARLSHPQNDCGPPHGQTGGTQQIHQHDQADQADHGKGNSLCRTCSGGFAYLTIGDEWLVWQRKYRPDYLKRVRVRTRRAAA